MRDSYVIGATILGCIAGGLVLAGLLLAGLIDVLGHAVPPCRPVVRNLGEHAVGSCWHPDHTATITTEHGPVLLVCSCPEVTP